MVRYIRTQLICTYIIHQYIRTYVHGVSIMGARVCTSVLVLWGPGCAQVCVVYVCESVCVSMLCVCVCIVCMCEGTCTVIYMYVCIDIRTCIMSLRAMM